MRKHKPLWNNPKMNDTQFRLCKCYLIESARHVAKRMIGMTSHILRTLFNHSSTARTICVALCNRVHIFWSQWHKRLINFVAGFAIWTDALVKASVEIPRRPCAHIHQIRIIYFEWSTTVRRVRVTYGRFFFSIYYSKESLNSNQSKFIHSLVWVIVPCNNKEFSHITRWHRLIRRHVYHDAEHRVERLWLPLSSAPVSHRVLSDTLSAARP